MACVPSFAAMEASQGMMGVYILDAGIGGTLCGDYVRCLPGHAVQAWWKLLFDVSLSSMLAGFIGALLHQGGGCWPFIGSGHFW